jgi:hypothetical protein
LSGFGGIATDQTKNTLTDEEIQKAFEVFGLSPEKKRRSLRSKMRSLRVDKDREVSYKIFEDRNVSPTQEEK